MGIFELDTRTAKVSHKPLHMRGFFVELWEFLSRGCVIPAGFPLMQHPKFLRQGVFPALLCRFGDTHETGIYPLPLEMAGGALGDRKEAFDIPAGDGFAVAE
ncbi:MAG: hypothetical protein ACKVT0_12675 [Planctomycetaceae bacterium]